MPASPNPFLYVALPHYYMRILAVKKVCLLVLVCCSPFWVFAQNRKGVVVDGTTGKPLFPASVQNMKTKETATTDEQGNFKLAAASGDQLTYSFVGYKTETRTVVDGDESIYIEMVPANIQLKEYVLSPGLTDYQKDSIAMRELYSKGLNTTDTKPTFGATGSGVGANGIIGSLVEKHSRVYKRNKRFQEDFQKDQEQKFIDTRYKPELVRTLTGFTGDTLMNFMHEYPLDYGFARAASELELKMWIRSNYKEYLGKMKLEGTVK